MSIAGNLKTMEFAELLQFLARSRKSGTLAIDNGRVEKRIIFEKGLVISSSSSDPKEYLGHFLVSHGFITESELVEGMELQRTKGTLLGKLLVTIGVMGEAEMEQMVAVKCEESVYDIFSWTEGEFRFIDGEVPDLPAVLTSLDVTRLVLNGIQRHDEWGEIRRFIPSLQGVPVALGELPDSDDEGTRRVLSLVDDERSIEEITFETHGTEFHVCKILHEQVKARRLKIVRPRALAAPAVDSAGPQAIDVNTLMRTAEQHVKARNLEAALRHLQAARSLEPDNRPLQEATERVEATIRHVVEGAGIALQAVVHPTRKPEELPDLALTPQEGFILSRINGSYDVETILKITPLPKLEAQVVLWRLLEGKHVRLERKGKKKA